MEPNRTSGWCSGGGGVFCETPYNQFSLNELQVRGGILKGAELMHSVGFAALP